MVKQRNRFSAFFI